MNHLEQISIVSNDLETHAAVFAAVCGCSFESSTAIGARRCWVGQALVEITQSSEGRAQGLDHVRFSVTNIENSRRELADYGIDASGTDEMCLAPEDANGISVRLGPPLTPGPSANPPARFDHVGICVADLDDATQRWEAITATAPAHVGEHPLGRFNTARFLLGPHMIELVSPKAGVDSAIAQRLDSRGEGVMAVAIVASNLAATRDQITAAGARLVEDPPHVFVHPRDAAGLLVQVTPRLDH